jgi:hypothetical protein
LHLTHVVVELIAVSGVSITAIQNLITRLLMSGSHATRLHHDLMIATSFDRTTHRYTVASICYSIATARVRQDIDDASHRWIHGYETLTNFRSDF